MDIERGLYRTLLVDHKANMSTDDFFKAMRIIRDGCRANLKVNDISEKLENEMFIPPAEAGIDRFSDLLMGYMDLKDEIDPLLDQWEQKQV